jgi:hypothetical protein
MLSSWMKNTTDAGEMLKKEVEPAAPSALPRYLLAQKRSNPNINSRATVMTAEISTDPKQPRRFEKKKSIPAQSDENAIDRGAARL